MHFAPNSVRYSDDLDFFHDTEVRVATAFASDRATLTGIGCSVSAEISLPGFVRAVVQRKTDSTRVDWARDSAWRFMPLVRDEWGGLLLHPVDLAINKLLTIAGRDEARDFVDILFVHERVLAIPALNWAAVGKDPGFTPLSLLELLKRRGRYHEQDFLRLRLAEPFDLIRAKQTWLAALDDAQKFARVRPAEESGCLYYSTATRAFVVPRSGASLADQHIVLHFGTPGGVLPVVPDAS